MNDIIFNSLNAFDFAEIIICTLVSLVLGALVAVVYSYKNHASRNFLIALSLLPAMIQVVIMMVNGNIGAGLAVAGAFTMVRFRSVTGNAKDITHVFFAVAIGLSTGMGELLFASAFTVLICLVLFFYSHFNFGQSSMNTRQLKITTDDTRDSFNAIEEVLRQNETGFEVEEIKYAGEKQGEPVDKIEYTLVISKHNSINERDLLHQLRRITCDSLTIRSIPYVKEKL